MSKWLDVSLTCTQISFKNKQSPSYSPMNSVFELEGHKLYLGNILAANDPQYLNSHSVGAVLSVIDTSEIKLDRSIIHLWIAAEDCVKVQLIKYFDQASNFIKDNLKHTNVLVHCYAGISRSSSLIIAYLMKYQGYTLNEALIKVKCQRPQVDPNDGFMEQLKQYETRLQKVKQQPKSESKSPGSNNKFISISASAEKTSKQQVGRQSITNFNIYSNYKLNNNTNSSNVEPIKTKTHINNLQLTTFSIPKQRTSYLEKSSPKATSVSSNKSKTFFTNSIEDPIKQYQKIKSTEQVFNKHILGLKNIYATHQRMHSTNY